MKERQELTVEQILPKPIEELIPSDKFPDLSAKNNPINTSANVAYLLNFYGITLRYNLMTNNPEFKAAGKHFSAVNEAECYFTEISNLCVKNGVPKIDLPHHILYIADQNRYHPAVEFINSQPWDGSPRVEEFLHTVKADKQEMADKLIYRWMVSCVHAAFSEKGASLEGALVFQGEQKIGKTHWFIKLVPEQWRELIKDSLHLDPTNKDSVIDCTNCWLGELAELDGTIKKSDVSAQKQFLTRSVDHYRVPFGRVSRGVPRRTAYYGSVNPTDFLSDDTGNRRYWTVSVRSINHNHDIDMQQVWAEIKNHMDNGESYRLTDKEQSMINLENDNHMPTCPIEEKIIARFRWDDDPIYHSHPMTATEVLDNLHMSLIEMTRNGAVKKCAAALTKLTGKKRRKCNGRKIFDLPRLKI